MIPGRMIGVVAGSLSREIIEALTEAGVQVIEHQPPPAPDFEFAMPRKIESKPYYRRFERKRRRS